MSTIDIQTALANEARRNELRQKIAQLDGKMSATSSVVQGLTSINNDSAIMKAAAEAELAALNQGAGPGITADFGPKSVVTQMIETERFAAKDACIDFVKANPECTEDEAAQAWNAAALASHPTFPVVIQDGLAMSALYRANLLAAKLIPEDSWEAHRQFIVVNSAPYIKGL